MFSLFKKNTEGPGFNIESLLGMAKPMLALQGIDLETIIPNAAAQLKLLQEQSGINIVAMIGVNDEGSGFDLGFFEVTADAMNCISKISVTDVPTAIEQLKSLPDTFANIILQKQQSNEISQLNTTEQHSGFDTEPGKQPGPAADASGSAGSPNEHRAIPSSQPGRNGSDQLDQPDAE